jgi:hypothetical protein
MRAAATLHRPPSLRARTRATAIAAAATGVLAVALAIAGSAHARPSPADAGRGREIPATDDVARASLQTVDGRDYPAGPRAAAPDSTSDAGAALPIR